MRLVVTALLFICVLSIHAQDTVKAPLPRSLAFPVPELWSLYNLTGIPDTVDVKALLFEEPPPIDLSDPELWSYLYLEDELDKEALVIIGTGDIMLGTNYPKESYLPPGQDCSSLLEPVHQVLRSGDLLFGNLEGIFCGEGGTPKRCRDLDNCYVFRMPDHFLPCILEAGYDVLSVANNHVNDFGPAGRSYTAALLDSAGVAYAGFVTHPWALFEKEGVRYGFAAFAPNTGTMDLRDLDRAAGITAKLDSLADVVIISVHGGAEGKDHQHVVRGEEMYLGENRGSVYHFAHRVVDAGADVVFGHGPHVTRAVELYRKRLICYSLGNFATYGRFNLRGPNGIAPIVKVTVDREGNFMDGEVISIYQSGEGGPRIDPAGRAASKLKALTETDFPEHDLVVDDDGILWIR
jgi:hypothetical protein